MLSGVSHLGLELFILNTQLYRSSWSFAQYGFVPSNKFTRPFDYNNNLKLVKTVKTLH